MAEGASPRVRAKPFAVATTRGKVKSLSGLSEFAIKASSTDSRVLDETADAFKDVYGDQGLIEPKYNPGLLKELIYMNTYHARACKTKARDVAGNEWNIVDRDPDARKEPDPEETDEPGTADPEHPAVDPLATPDADPATLLAPALQKPKARNRARGTASNASPNADEHKRVREQIEEYETPLVETMYEVWLDFEVCGYGAFEIVRQDNRPDGEVSDLVHIPAETLRRHKTKKKYQQKVGNATVWYKDVTYKGEIDYESGAPLGTPTDDDDDMQPANDPGFMSFYRSDRNVQNDDDRRATEVVWIEQADGVPDIIPAIPSLYGDQSREEYNISFFENYGVPSMMLLITGDYDPGEEDAHGVTDLEKFLESRLSELIEEPFSNLVVSIPTQTSIGDERRPSVSIQAVPLGTSVNDASFRLYRQDNRDEVLTANQVDPYRAQVIVEGSLGGSTAGESTEIYKTSTLKPKQTMLEHRLNRYVIRANGNNPNSKIEFARLDNRDQQREISIAAILFANAAMTPNELIDNFQEIFNLGGTVDHPAMDLHYMGGKPIDSDDPISGEAGAVLEQIKSTLGEVVGESEEPEGDEEIAETNGHKPGAGAETIGQGT